MDEAVIVDVVRTPLGRGKARGALAGVHPVDLLALTLQALVERTGIDPDLVEDVLGGCVGQVGEQSTNIARSAVLAAGFPEHVPATTIDRQCGSSQQAAHFAAQAVMAGVNDIVIACGVESMSRVPMGSAKAGKDHFGPMVAARYPEGLVSQGISAELIAAKWQLDREASDEFAVRSQRLAAAARDAGLLAREIVPVSTTDAGGDPVTVDADEGIRPTTTESLAALKPVFYDATMAQRFPEIGWTVTAGNSSQLTDGAAAMLIMSRRRADELGLAPRAVFRAFSVIGDDPLYKLTGIIPATEAVVTRSGIPLGDIDLFEVNEAFASVVLAWESELGVDRDRINVHGGAIALGHPLGASGVRLTGSLLNTMRLRGARYGLQVMCEGGGMANAMIVEALA
ncbi:thiolase family protein [Dactylosporangium sp. CA-092794]|uniref:thiolase family protein n=1 Tax=Dactylosporangium sp. CA-092794 TaxID=3239929 RepID=UPI003D94A729